MAYAIPSPHVRAAYLFLPFPRFSQSSSIRHFQSAPSGALPRTAEIASLDHLLHPVAAVKPARILHSVRGDDKQRMLRDIWLPGVLVDIADVMDRTADGIQKSRAPPNGIVPVGHRLDGSDVHAVMELKPPKRHDTTSLSVLRISFSAGSSPTVNTYPMEGSSCSRALSLSSSERGESGM